MQGCFTGQSDRTVHSVTTQDASLTMSTKSAKPCFAVSTDEVLFFYLCAVALIYGYGMRPYLHQ